MYFFLVKINGLVPTILLFLTALLLISPGLSEARELKPGSVDASSSTFPSEWEGGGTYPAAAWVDVAFGNGKYAAIAKDGTVGTSTDGKRWTIVKDGGRLDNWTSIAFGDGKFVALTFGTDKALFSSDGVSWSEEKSMPGAWSDITYGNGQFIAVSAQGGIQASDDGQNWFWRMRDTGDRGRPGWRGVDFYNGQFITAAYSGDSRIATSDNGWDWSFKNFNEAKLLAAAAGPDKMVVGGFSGELFFSEDSGETWQRSETSHSGQIADLIYADGYFIAVTNSSVILYSSDGNTWQETNGRAGFLQSLANGSAGLVAVGNWGRGYGLYAVSCCPEQNPDPSAPIEEAPAGVNWKSSELDEEGYLWRGLAFGNDKFVSTSADGQAMTSEDGFAWESSEMPTAPGPYSLAFGEGKFVGVVFGSQQTVYSSDGINWAKSSLAPARGDRPDSVSAWSDIEYANNKFVAVSTGGGIQTSPDGVTWYRRVDSGQVNSPTLRGVAFGNGKFVAVGEGGEKQAYISKDGVDWSLADMPEGRWQNVAFGNGQFVAVSLDGKIIKSTDGRNWESVYTNYAGSQMPIYSVTFADGQFLALAMDPINIGVYGSPRHLTRMLASSDGQNWFERAAELGSFPEITFGDQRFVSVSGGTRINNITSVALPGGFIEPAPEPPAIVEAIQSAEDTSALQQQLSTPSALVVDPSSAAGATEQPEASKPQPKEQSTPDDQSSSAAEQTTEEQLFTAPESPLQPSISP